ncbi:hypothetical protein Baya_12063 [Bagarius yarrelli]|uniref:Uncharacterized protein n=1 Tax=Bagarius yarrelli TaxID=175774 RepID=A0A556V2M0_BAGYA|nr:hypothetical protein Baya_12063 [Bagarius yarrelli]
MVDSGIPDMSPGAGLGSGRFTLRLSATFLRAVFSLSRASEITAAEDSTDIAVFLQIRQEEACRCIPLTQINPASWEQCFFLGNVELRLIPISRSLGLAQTLRGTTSEEDKANSW